VPPTLHRSIVIDIEINLSVISVLPWSYRILRFVVSMRTVETSFKDINVGRLWLGSWIIVENAPGC